MAWCVAIRHVQDQGHRCATPVPNAPLGKCPNGAVDGKRLCAAHWLEAIERARGVVV